MATTPQGFRLLVRIVEALAFFAIFVLMMLQYIPLTVSNTDALLHNATLQQAISQRIAKDALLLQYGSTSDGVQAINELQNMLPTWEHNQTALQNGYLPVTAESLLLSSNSSYVSIDAAAHAIVAHPQTTDLVQIQIIRNQERTYFVAISQVANALQQQEYDGRVTLFWIEEVVCGILIVIKTTFVVVVERTIGGYLRREGLREN